MLFTDLEGSAIVVKRLKDQIDKLNDAEFKHKFTVELQLKIGAAQYDKLQPVPPLELIAQAKRTMEYDV